MPKESDFIISAIFVIHTTKIPDTGPPTSAVIIAGTSAKPSLNDGGNSMISGIKNWIAIDSADITATVVSL